MLNVFSIAKRRSVIVKQILREYGYRTHKPEKATQLVLEQAEVLSGDWAGSPA